MNCLWLTLTDPDPATNGAFLYSSGLIRAMAESGARLDVLGLCRPDGSHGNGDREGDIRWWLMPHRPLAAWRSLPSLLPRMADRIRTRAMRRALHRLIAEKRWDAVVFDSLPSAWALAAITARWPAGGVGPAIAYLAHNHEETLAMAIARLASGRLRRSLLTLDALKVARLERAAATRADLVTADGPDEADLFRARHPAKRVMFLPPGYAGRRVLQRQIDARTPRRAIVVGSFDWSVKRANLESFLRAADPLFAAARIDLQIVGAAEPDYLAGLRLRYPATTFTGAVDDVGPYLARARLAIVPEAIGSGFRLKTLDYVFHRVPVLALPRAAPGLPLQDGHSVVIRPTQAELARTAVSLIDDFDGLNRLQDNAYAACCTAFDWADRGRELLAGLDAGGTSRRRSPDNGLLLGPPGQAIS